MAEDGKSKPSTLKTNIGQCLARYTNPNYKYYDPVFTAKIKKLAPHWLITKFDIAIQKKQQLIAMAKKGKPKPKQISQIGVALVNYTNKKSESYDPNFTKEIKKIAPLWFGRSSQQSKIKLISMAKKGLPKPKTNTPIGAKLNNYTRKECSSFDPIFSKEIRRLAPHWFISSSDKKKRELIAMAKKGEPRPKSRGSSLKKPRTTNELGVALIKYTLKSSNSYDPVFDKQIRRLAPHWFKRKCSTN